MNLITNPLDQNIELGKVTWLRDYDEALAESKTTNKPVLLFFQEIPGCSTCVNYGREVLSHPLMVELIENEFVPLAIYNNKPGKDAEILKRYDEMSWNNPVTRFVDSNGIDIAGKLANNYHPLGLYNKIIDVLIGLNKDIPKYAKLLEGDLKIKHGIASTTIFETPCFWSGETSFAQFPAVFSTEAGWIGHKEVVKIYYDKELASVYDLNAFAEMQGFYTTDKHETYRIDEDPQFYLKKTDYKYLPLSPSQRTKINYAIPYKADPESFLSPKQKALLHKENLKNLKPIYSSDIESAWMLSN